MSGPAGAPDDPRAASVRHEVQAMIDGFHEIGRPDFTHLTVAEARGLLGGTGPVSGLPEIHEQRDIVIEGPGGPLTLRVSRPFSGHDAPVLVWFHGGGWVLGDLDSSELPTRHLANLVPCVVVSVDYRLAPETPFPGAFEDAWSAIRWVMDQAPEIGVDPSRVAVGGESAGANLAAAVALEAAESGIALLGQLLASPVTTYNPDAPSMVENATGYLLTREGLEWFWNHYAQGCDRTDRRIAPFDGLSTLPDPTAIAPAWIYTAGFDPLRDDGIAYATALADMGIDVATMHVNDVIHGVFSADLECGAEARQVAADWLRALVDRRDSTPLSGSDE